MSYLPTAQRLSFSVIKATNLKYEEITDSVENFGELELRARGSMVRLSDRQMETEEAD